MVQILYLLILPYRDSSANEHLFSDTGLKNAYRISLYNKESKVLIDDEKLLQETCTYIPRLQVYMY